MRNSIPLEETMKSEAEFGLFYVYSRISNKKAQELRKQGFIVIDSNESNKSPRIHKICWIHSVVDFKNLEDLNDKDEIYTLPQRLWIISMKNNLSINS